MAVLLSAGSAFDSRLFEGRFVNGACLVAFQGVLLSPTPEAEARQNIDAMLAAHPEDLAKLAQRIRPKAVIPIHTEAAAQFAGLMSNVKVLEDGVPVELNDLYA